MALNIDTFSNVKGGNAFFKAAGHPWTARKAPAFLDRLAQGPVAVYDPFGFASAFAELYDLSALDLAGVFVQDLSDLGKTVAWPKHAAGDRPQGGLGGQGSGGGFRRRPPDRPHPPPRAGRRRGGWNAAT